MEFEIEFKSAYDERDIVYHAVEQEFDMNSSIYTDFTLMVGCGYLGIDVSLLSSEIVGISGFCPQKLWISSSLYPPNIKENGVVKIQSNDELCSGTGISLFDDAQIYYDNKNKYCYIDGHTKLVPKHNIRLGKNAIISLCGKIITGIWIRIITD